MNSVETYNTISKMIGNTFYPVASHPSPTDQDYVNGLFTRFFYRKFNDKKYIEITENDYNMVIYNKFCEVISVNWDLVGSRNNISENGILQVMGVEETNKLVLKTYPNLKYTIVDFLEFWQGH